MRALVCKITLALAVACSYGAAVSCGDNGGNPDGGGGAGGSGGTGGSGGAMDASDGKPPGTVGCLTPDTTPTTCPTPRVTFDDVKPIFQARCVSACHNGVTPDPNIPGATLWPLVERMHILDWQDSVRAMMADCSMPPPDAGVPMTIEDRRAIIEFIRCEGREAGVLLR
jgi:hypothetical protein